MKRKFKLTKCDYKISENCEEWSKRCTTHVVFDDVTKDTYKYMFACPNCENCFDDE